MKSLIALPTVHCTERPICLWKPSGTDLPELIRFWWRMEDLPHQPNFKDPGDKSSPEWNKYREECFRRNRMWAAQGLIKLPSDFIMRWQRAAANWLIKTHSFVEQPVEYLDLKSI